MERPVERIFDKIEDGEESGSKIKALFDLLTGREKSVFMIMVSQEGEYNMEDVARHLEVKTPAVWRAVQGIKEKAATVYGIEEINTRQVKRGRK